MTTVIVADVGGTHARFALADIEDGRVVSVGAPVTLKTADYDSFGAAWAAYRAGLSGPAPRVAGIAVATPVGGEVIRFTNNPWVIRPAELNRELGLDGHVLVNDFGAVAHAVAQAPPSELVHVCGPDRPLPAEGVISICGPGTGLGVAQLLRTGDTYDVLETEGGHIGFAPLDPFDDALVARLRERFGRVSAERIVAGPGLRVIYDLLTAGDARKYADDRALWTAALRGDDPRGAAALERFCQALGAVAGDLALAHGATGVVIAGGLGLRLRDRLANSGFAERFAAKGRFAAMLAGVPVKLIVHPEPGLFGAAAAFARLRSE